MPNEEMNGMAGHVSDNGHRGGHGDLTEKREGEKPGGERTRAGRQPAAAITRGLGAPIKRTNICQLKFNFADVVLILFCCFVVFWAIASPIISAGGILP